MIFNSVADPDPGSGIGFFRIPDLGSRTPNPYKIILQFYAICGYKKSMLRIRFREPVPFWPLYPGSGIGFFPDPGSRYPGSQTYIFYSLVTKFW